MKYRAFTDDALLMMHHSTRGALAVDDELTRLGAERRFHVRDNSDWKQHADDLEAEMRQRGMVFEAIDWLASEEPGVVENAALQPEPSPPDPAPNAAPAAEPEDGNARLKKRIAAFIKMP